MQIKTFTSTLALAAIVSAQTPSLTDVPSCAMAPALAAFGKTGCALTDIKCLCSKQSLVPDLESAVSQACSASDLAKVNQFAVDTCKQYAGITLVIPGYNAGSNSTTSAAGSSTSGAAMTTGSSSSSSAATTGASTTTSGSMTSTASTSSSSTSPTSTGAAANVKVASGALAGALMFALAL